MSGTAALLRWSLLWVVPVGLWALWYAWIGPAWFFAEGGWMLDLVRPWLIFRAHLWPPVAVFWIGALWGILQDIVLGHWIGLYGFVWGTETVLLVILRSVLNIQSWVGTCTTVIALIGFQYSALEVLHWVLGFPLHLHLGWMALDIGINIVFLRIYFLWWERVRHVASAPRTHTV